MKSNKNKIIKSKRNKFLILGIIVFILVGVLTLRLTRAASYDGYQRLRIINSATSQLGNKEYNAQVLKYSEGRIENWCADFVSWVYLNAGYPFYTTGAAGRSTWRIPLAYKEVSGVPNLRSYFIANNAYKYKESGYVPGAGDVVIFSRLGRSHTGIIERVDRPANKNENYIYTIEGNSSTQDVARRSYPMSEGTIDGYGTIIDTGPVPGAKN
jgi:hypothetical protein